MGRVGMGPMESMQEQKGLMGNVTLGGKKLEGYAYHATIGQVIISR